MAQILIRSVKIISLLSNLEPDERTIISLVCFPGSLLIWTPTTIEKSVENDIDFFDHFGGFLVATSELPDTYYQTHKTHLNMSETKKPPRHIDQIYKITGSAGPREAFRDKTQPNKPYRDSQYKPRSRFCHTCSLNNHSTHECWISGRNSGLSGRVTRRGPLSI